MRSYIQPLEKRTEDELKVRLEHGVAEDLKQYCQFLDSPQSYVVTEIIRKALRKDKAFHTWRAQRDGAEGSHRGTLHKNGSQRCPPQASPTAS